MRSLVRPLMYQAGLVVVGVAVLGLVSATFGSIPNSQPPALLVLFGALYVAVARLVRRRVPTASPWSASGLRPSVAALAIGVAVYLLPHLLVHPSLAVRVADGSRGFGALSAGSLALTVCAVSWEELWFRNPVLDLVPSGFAAVVFALFNGLLFAALHLLNPSFVPLVEGPELVAAGALLTLAYAAMGSFYVPLALHLGNNLASSVLRSAVGPDRQPDLDAPEVTWWRTGMLAVAVVVMAWHVSRRGAPDHRTENATDTG